MKLKSILVSLYASSWIGLSSQAAVLRGSGVDLHQQDWQKVLDDDDDHDDPPSDCVIQCPEDPEDQYLPNPEDCNSFYQCSNGLPILQPCPEGLEFDRVLNACNFPEDAQCKSIDCKDASQYVKVFLNVGLYTPGECKHHACPATGESRQRDPFNCHAYFECSDGLGVVKKCKKDSEVFDPNKHKCVSSDDYDCKETCKR